ncbi:hypothetical protein SASPL_140561 [Salvia splendens]|uniref:Uncharacterized protein n=1 Tax=Salvia splendens TaxID=180675 RepID=A0A8X8ZBG9_SALSN|nr:hypothetical protein SASPL_140561 [Salvia splendens]
MAMQSGAMVVPDKIPVQWYNHQQQPPHYQVDEREGCLMWLRGEFAAANAIIDALCHHLMAVGEPGEYDGVIGSVQQRRCNWNPILHMQQYYSVADVVYALQQVGWRRQQKVVGFEGGARMGGGGNEFRRGGRGQRGGLEVQNFGGEMNKKDLNNGYCKSNLKMIEKLDEGDKTKVEKEEDSEGSCNMDASGLVEKSNLEVSPKSFVASEICDGISVNIAEGLKLYEDLFDDSEILKLNNVVNDLRAAGKRGQLQAFYGDPFALSVIPSAYYDFGETLTSVESQLKRGTVCQGNALPSMFILTSTFVEELELTQRPMKGHGREMIQLGVPIADAPPEDEVASGTSRDPKIEPIPVALQDVVERLLNKNVVSTKPDSAIIDIFNEGDHSQPNIWPQWFGRPVCVISLTVCEMSFGKAMPVDNPGSYRCALKLSLSPGSTIVMQGRSADVARHAIPSLQRQRMLVTLVKSQSKKTIGGDAHHFLPPTTTWAPPPSRPPSHIRPGAANYFGPVTPAGVSPARQQLPPPNGIQVQPMFVSAPVAPGIAYPAPVALPPTSAGWPAAPPRHPQPRLPVPGTGVFLPSQGSSKSSNQTAATENNSMETLGSAGKSNGSRSSPKVDGEATKQECNGGSDESKEEEQECSGGAV